MQIITIDKEQSFENFFLLYGINIEGTLFDQTEEKIREYLDGCLFIASAAAASSIPEQEFFEYGVQYFLNHSFEEIQEKFHDSIPVLKEN